jgi:hypothetical protein
MNTWPDVEYKKFKYVSETDSDSDYDSDSDSDQPRLKVRGYDKNFYKKIVTFEELLPE